MDLCVVNYASPRSRIGDFSRHSSVQGAKCWDVLASRASAGQAGLSAQGAEPEGRRYRFGIRPLGIDRTAARVLGAVPGQTSRDG